MAPKNQKSDSKDGKGKGEAKRSVFDGNAPRESKCLTPKPAYSLESVMRELRRRKNVAQAVVPVPKSDRTLTVIFHTPKALGIRMLGGLDYLAKAHGYGSLLISQEEFNDLVKAKKIKPFVALKDATAAD